LLSFRALAVFRLAAFASEQAHDPPPKPFQQLGHDPLATSRRAESLISAGVSVRDSGAQMESNNIQEH
jgi:hypothetical protein